MYPLTQILIAFLLVTFSTKQTQCRSIHDQEILSPRMEEIQRHLDIVEDDGSMDAALLNYLFAKQMIERLSNGRDISELQQKRSYWKQCAFNAVSCFGRRK